MSIKDWFLSAAGAAYLTEHYVLGNKSTYELAKEKGTYPNMVRRALVYHALERRNKSDAQKQALKMGRHPHPTRGRQRPDEVRNRIRKGVQNARKQEAEDADTGFPFGKH